MTRLEKDIKEIQEGNEIEVLKRRKQELEKLYKEDVKKMHSKGSVLHRNTQEN